MILIIIFASLGMILPWMADHEIPLEFVILFMFVGAAFGAIFGLPFSESLPQHAVEEKVIYLHNLYDTPEMSGGFFLGTGSFDTDEMYHYNQVVDGYDTRYEYAEIAKVRAMVDEDNPARPYLQKYHMEYDYGWSWLLTIFPADDATPKPVFHIPAGSIDTNFQSR